MGMIDRYRKKGGFVQLLILIESTAQPKQDKFLQIIQDENATWEKAIRDKMLTPEKIYQMDQSIFLELIPRVPVSNWAHFLSACPEPKKSEVIKLLSHRDQKNIQEAMEGRTSTSAEIHTCFVKVAAEFREIAKEGKLKLEKTNPDLFIPENIEETFGSGHFEHLLGDLDIPSTSDTLPKVEAGKNLILADEEIRLLKKKLVTLQTEFSKVTQENQILKSKLEQIKKIA